MAWAAARPPAPGRLQDRKTLRYSTLFYVVLLWLCWPVRQLCPHVYMRLTSITVEPGPAARPGPEVLVRSRTAGAAVLLL